MNIIKLFLLSVAAMCSSLYSYAGSDLHTIETKHARIHFSSEYQAMAQLVANKFEPIYQDVSKRVGFEQNDKLDLLISDKNHSSNGSALPLAAGKIVTLHASLPRSESITGGYSDFFDILISHELVHKIHVSEPRRSWRSWLDPYLLDVDRLNLKRYPRWVSEGYATLIESEFTGKGRVNNDYVKALLEQWALEGQLPTYRQLSSRSGNGMAYMQGSAFLVWLQDKYGKEKLQQLWRRSTATKYRNFHKAFKGLFLETPNVLYKKFVVEQTYLAKQAQAKQSQQTDVVTNKITEDENSAKLWQNNGFIVLNSEPSPNNKQILQLERDKKGFTRLRVFDFAENKKAKEKFIKANNKRLKKDPLDVADTMPKVFNKKQKYLVKPGRYLRWRQAKWLDDSHILVLQAQRQSNNEQGFELAKVNIKTGRVEQITRESRISDYAVNRDQQSVTAVSQFALFSQLVKVSLNDGNVIPLSAKHFNLPMDNLTVSPSGEQVALMSIENGQWKIHLYHFSNKTWQVINLPIKGNFLSYLRWQNDGLYFSHSAQNDADKNNDYAINVYRLNMQEQTWQQLTQGIKLTAHAASVDDQLLFLATSSQGQDTYIKTIEVIDSGSFEQVVLTQAKETSKAKLTNNAQEHFAIKDYGIGPQAFSGSFVGFASNDDKGAGLVVRGGDPLGRLRWQAGVTEGDLHQAYALLAKGNWLDINWFAEYVNNTFESPAFTQDLELVNIEASKRLYLNNDTSWLISASAGNSKIDDFSIDNWKLKTGIHYRNHWNNLSYGVFANAQLADYQGDSANWQGADYNLGLNFGLGKKRVKYCYNDFKLDDNAPTHAMLTYGGMKTTNTSQVSSQIMLNNRLPLAWQQGHQFKQHHVELNGFGPKLFYLAHQTDDNDTLQAYGLELVIKKVRSASPLLDGYSINAGISWFETEETIKGIKTNQQYYLSIGYQFK